MRFVLALIAAIANAAGPWLCCCAVGAMLHSPSPVKAETSAFLPIVEKCTHCCKHEAAPVVESQPQPGKSKPNTPCPCQERLESIPAATPAVSETISVVDSLGWNFTIPATFATTVLESTPTATRENERPFYPPETRQRVHHVLHC